MRWRRTDRSEVGRKGGQNGLSRAIFSAYSTRVNAGIAQLVEQLICNQQVVGSNPTAGSLDFQTFECRFAIARKRSGHTRLNAPAFQWPRLDAFNSEFSSLLL